MNTDDFPVVISPNLGCPLIVSLDDLADEDRCPVRLIVAYRSSDKGCPSRELFTGRLSLVPSYQENLPITEIPLTLKGDPTEITNWNALADFTSSDDTRLLINNEIHYHILGVDTRYWIVDATVEMDRDRFPDLLRKKNGVPLPTLYDLVLSADSRGRKWVNYHCVQFVETVTSGCNFIHVTDLHLAARNDEILDEVLKVKHDRPGDEIKKSYKNFNDKFRRFIRFANEQADQGKLDFVVITGDLVDFAFRGWVTAANDAENNWKTFINIVTGSGAREKSKGNPGIKVAIFTSTGNHDWRMFPYDPNLREVRPQYGLLRQELRAYNYKAFDAEAHAEHERVKETEALIAKQFSRFNLGHFEDKVFLQVAKLVASGTVQWAVPPLVAALGLTGARAAGVSTQWPGLLRSGVYGLMGLGLGVASKALFDGIIEKWVHLLASNPLHAEAKSLHYYLRHINPYFDYAFTYGDHSFVVMDTGPDACVAPLQDGKTLESIKIMTYSKSILSGSPDSRAFDSEQTHYHWSQIVWLEKALEALNPRSDTSGRTFVFVHSPPINFKTTNKCTKDNLWESRRTGKKHQWIPQKECGLSFGTINHFLSQFWYLCLGLVESDLAGCDTPTRLNEVDVVFSGHTHRNFEFRLSMDENCRIRIYSDPYSDNLANLKPTGREQRDAWWETFRPILVQTAACGPRKYSNQKPPYCRVVSIDEYGVINDFRSMSVP